MLGGVRAAVFLYRNSLTMHCEQLDGAVYIKINRQMTSKRGPSQTFLGLLNYLKEIFRETNLEESMSLKNYQLLLSHLDPFISTSLL